MTFISYYQQKKTERYQKNAVICQQTASNVMRGVNGKAEKALIQKIENAVERGQIYWATVEEILKQMSEGDKTLLMHFAIDPTRQTLSEETQLKYVNDEKHISLKKHVGDLRLVNDGSMIVKGKKAGARSKSFDYQIDEYYGIGKVTFSKGGHQDNVEEEVRKYLTECVNYTRYNEDGKKFFFLLDGDFWSDSVIETLKRYQNERVKIFNSDDFFLF